jgi:shikimate dehydrogenase
MPDLYAVIGNPVAHSRSPDIHAAFARQTAQDMEYVRVLAPLDGFVAAVEQFRHEGGRGANVTLPFKEEAFGYATRHSERARAAGAVNTLRFDGSAAYGDNTDGAGLVRDIQDNLRRPLSGARILLLGAGGAARGVIHPLLAPKPQRLMVANRTPERALALALSCGGSVEGGSFGDLTGRQFDIVINATSASLAGEALALPDGLYAAGALAYDLMYGKDDTPFMQQASREGAARIADGLGMLVEQAAESFFLWRAVRPDTVRVLAALRQALA